MDSWITYVCGTITFIGVVLTVWAKIRERRENRRGWHLSVDSWGIRYVEQTKDGAWVSLLVRATFRGHGFDEVHIPSEAVWNTRYPSWAHCRRDEIVARIRGERRWLPFVDEDLKKLPQISSVGGKQPASEETATLPTIADQ